MIFFSHIHNKNCQKKITHPLKDPEKWIILILYVWTEFYGKIKSSYLCFWCYSISEARIWIPKTIKFGVYNSSLISTEAFTDRKTSTVFLFYSSSGVWIIYGIPHVSLNNILVKLVKNLRDGGGQRPESADWKRIEADCFMIINESLRAERDFRKAQSSSLISAVPRTED